jgi:alkylhydroperoxidase family enzyme
MAWIRTIPPGEARGVLRAVYDAAVKRAGKVFGILSIQSLNPRVLRASTALYRELMHCEGPLARYQREMIAVVVSRANGCHY